MVQKPNVICVIAPVAVAGILTLAILATISSTNRAFAQEKPTELTVSVSPDTFGASSYHVKGNLSSEGKGVGGATITFTWYKSGLGLTANSGAQILSPTETNSDGTYSVSGSITRDSVIAHYAGDNEHSPAKSKMIVLKRE